MRSVVQTRHPALDLVSREVRAGGQCPLICVPGLRSCSMRHSLHTTLAVSKGSPTRQEDRYAGLSHGGIENSIS